MRRKQRNHQDRWQPMADVFSALALIFMLLLMLMLATWINDAYYENDYNDYESSEVSDEEDGHRYDYPKTENGGGSQNLDYEETKPNEDEDEYGEKIAVRVLVVDENNKIIAKPEIQFRLYNQSQQQQTLHTYYPVKKGYQTFETTEDGTFYLPEKLEHGEYTLRNITAPTGYVSGGSLTFNLDETHDWHEPYIVHFMLEPIHSNFMIRVVDEYTGKPVSGGLFEVYATEDLIYANGTVFAHKGDVIDKLIPDENGYAESQDINFHSNLAIRQVKAAEYYAVLKDDVTVPTYEVSQLKETPTIEIPVTMSEIAVSVQDEFDSTKLSDIGLSLTEAGSSDVRNYLTDENGSVSIVELKKNTDYILTQTVWNDMYMEISEPHRFHVDKFGYINDSIVAQDTFENRMLRLNLCCHDWFSYNNLKDYTIQLTDDNGVCVAETSSDDGLIKGIEPGIYRIELIGKWNRLLSSGEIEVTDNAEPQDYNIYVLTVRGLIILTILGAVLIIMLTFGIAAVIRHRRKIKQYKTEKERETIGK